MGRKVIEMLGRQGAGIIDETDDWYWIRVLDKFEMYVNKHDESVTPCLVRDGFWEAWISTYIASRIGPGTVFYDVGANTGYYSFLANYQGAMVSAYEPNPAYYNMMKATIDRQNVSRMPIRVSDYAVSNEVGAKTLYIPKKLHGSASFRDMDAKWETTPLEVKTVPLNLGGAGHYLVKIDAEGAEERIWHGMMNEGGLRGRIGPTEILMEYTPDFYSDDFINELTDYTENGICYINDAGEKEPVSKEWVLNQKDWVMLSLKENFGRRLR